MSVDQKVYDAALNLVERFQPDGMEVSETMEVADRLAVVLQTWLEDEFPIE